MKHEKQSQLRRHLLIKWSNKCLKLFIFSFINIILNGKGTFRIIIMKKCVLQTENMSLI